jgi:hypothetical protein
LITTSAILTMEKDLDTISVDENAVFFYHFIQISATV